MSKTWFIGCTHFGHRNIIKFTDDDGNRIRPFDSVEQMDELMIENWNSVVGDKDRVYMMGDFCINRKYIPTAERLNGRKVLIKGNHDIFKLKDYLPYFDDIRAFDYKNRDPGVILSHVPIHPGSLKPNSVNAHAHIHQNVLDDSRYINLCVEQINYTPVEWEQVLTWSEERIKLSMAISEDEGVENG